MTPVKSSRIRLRYYYLEETPKQEWPIGVIRQTSFQ